MKHLQTTNLTNLLETRKKALTEIGKFSADREDEIIIRAQGELPIKAYDYSKPESKKLIIATFVEWSHMVGAKEPNTADENIVNAKFVITNFGDMTISEIRQAIHWSILDKLGIDATCYGKVSPIYMAKVLNAYLNVRDSKMAIMRYKLSQKRQEEAAKAKFDKPLKERLAEKRTFLIEHLNLMRKQRVKDVAGMLVWKFLLRAKLVSDSKFNSETKEYAKGQLQELKMSKGYRIDIQKLTQAQVMDSDESYVQRCMQDYTIWQFLETAGDITKLVSSQPDDVIIPKEQH